MPRLAVALIALLLAEACVSTSNIRPVELTDEQLFHHATPRRLGARVRAEQKIEARYGEKGGTFISVLEVTPEKMTVLAATPTGQRMFTLQLSETGTLDFDPGILQSMGIRPEYIIADIQLIFWPPDAVRDALRESKLTLRVTDTPRVKREVLLDGRPVLDIEYSDKNPWRGSIVFRNFDRKYTFTIVNLNFEKNK